MVKFNWTSYSSLSAFWTFMDSFPEYIQQQWTSLMMSCFQKHSVTLVSFFWKEMSCKSIISLLFVLLYKTLINLSTTYLFTFTHLLPLYFLPLFLILLHFYSLLFLFLVYDLHHLSCCSQHPKEWPVNNLLVFFKAISSNTTSYSVLFITNPAASSSLNWFL